MPRNISTTTKRAARTKGRAVPASVPYEPWLIERLKDPAHAAAYLEAVIEDGDQSAIMLALRQVAQAHGGIARIARRLTEGSRCFLELIDPALPRLYKGPAGFSSSEVAGPPWRSPSRNTNEHRCRGIPGVNPAQKRTAWREQELKLVERYW